MSDISRRLFLKRGSFTVAAAGAVVAIPGAAGLLSEAEAEGPAVTKNAGAVSSSTTSLAQPLIAHVKDLSTGEISLFMGEHEFTYRDPQMAARLFQAAR
ncbi:MAG: hypothetical protein M3063_05695 [Actinomycetota bacterium]|nr:hypothetical protein [Actinomycetota bacterium]